MSTSLATGKPQQRGSRLPESDVRSREVAMLWRNRADEAARATLVKQYKERFPNVKLIFRELTHAAQEAALRQDRIDVSITRPPFHRDLAETLDAISLVREPLIAAVPRLRTAILAAQRQQLQRLRYAASRAERQYQQVDPENRLIAAELERRWEAALRELREAGVVRRRRLRVSERRHHRRSRVLCETRFAREGSSRGVRWRGTSPRHSPPRCRRPMK